MIFVLFVLSHNVFLMMKKTIARIDIKNSQLKFIITIIITE
jgi:hypothetical protein